MDEENRTTPPESVGAGLSSNIKFSFPSEVVPEERIAREGLCERMASAIRERNPELSFDRLVQIIFTANVWETVSRLEHLVKHELPAARNGAQDMLVFGVDLGSVDVMVIREEWLNLFAADPSKADYALWQYLTTLTSINYYTIAKARFTEDAWLQSAEPADRVVFGISSDLLASYWEGYFAYLPAVQTSAPFDLLAESMSVETQQIEAAFNAHSTNADPGELFTELHGCAMFLCRSMATAMGHCDAVKQSLPTIAPDVWAAMQRANFDDLWLKLGTIVRGVFAGRHRWASAHELVPLCQIPAYFIEKLGINFTSDGGKAPFQVCPPAAKEVH